MSAAYASRYEAVFLCSHPKGPKMSYTAAAKYMKKSKTFISKWVKRYLEVKNVDDLPNRGTKSKTTKTEDKLILREFEKNPRLSLRSGQAVLCRKGLKLSCDTIRRRLLANNVKFRSTIKKPLLSEKHVTKRLAWANENLNRDWDNVIFSDETSFWAHTFITHTWCTHANKLLQRTVKHPVKVHVWGCFSKQGFGTLHVFTDNLNAAKMVKIYQRALLPSAQRWFIRNNKHWLLQEDNDPKHRSRHCTAWKEENQIDVLDWPSQSPDANPIENVWAIMKIKLRGKKLNTIKKLIRQIRLVWRSLSRDYAITLVESMPRRCKLIIDNGGDWTPY